VGRDDIDPDLRRERRHRSLRTIWVTHMHLDHYGGLSVRQRHFPEFLPGLPTAITVPEPYDKDWIADLDRLAALNPKTAVAGHKKVGLPDTPDAIEGSKRYLTDFGRLKLTSDAAASDAVASAPA
jgi:glyoxylase-like metal-dependent hydrolase (beta-lactamase superfamily II)